jgi:hypothetical protein
MKTVETTTADQAATVAEQGAPVAPEKAPSKKGASQKKGAPKATKSAKQPAPKKAAKAPWRARAKKGASEERVNKKAEVILLMKRPKGVTLPEIVELTGWQKHTIRGFVSLLASKGGEKVESTKNPAGERTYRITK